MKRLALILLLVSASFVSAQKVDQATLREQIKSLKEQKREEVNRVEKDLKASKEYAVSLWTDLDKAQTQVNKIGDERDGWKAYGEDRNERWLNAEKRVAEQKVGKLKWMGSFLGLLILVIAYFGLKFFTPLGKFIP